MHGGGDGLRYRIVRFRGSQAVFLSFKHANLNLSVSLLEFLSQLLILSGEVSRVLVGLLNDLLLAEAAKSGAFTVLHELVALLREHLAHSLETFVVDLFHVDDEAAEFDDVSIF